MRQLTSRFHLFEEPIIVPEEKLYKNFRIHTLFDQRAFENGEGDNPNAPLPVYHDLVDQVEGEPLENVPTDDRHKTFFRYTGGLYEYVNDLQREFALFVKEEIVEPEIPLTLLNQLALTYNKGALSLARYYLSRGHEDEAVLDEARKYIDQLLTTVRVRVLLGRLSDDRMPSMLEAVGTTYEPDYVLEASQLSKTVYDVFNKFEMPTLATIFRINTDPSEALGRVQQLLPNIDGDN